MGELRRHVAGDLLGALNGAATTIAISVAVGTLVFAPLGPQALAPGVVASLLAAVVGGAVAALATSTPLTISSPRAATCVVVAGFVATLHRARPDLPDATVIALTSLVVVVAGLIQASAAALRLGRLVRFVPFPVIAGFTHGVALVLVLVYLPLLLGLTNVPALAFPHPDRISWGPAVLGLVAFATALGVSRASAKAPALFVAMVVGIAAQLAFEHWVPGFDAGAAINLAGASLAGAPFGHGAAVMQALREPALIGHVLSFAMTVACVSSVDSLVGSMAVETRLGIRARPDHDLLAQGLGNAVAGAAGGIAITYGSVQALAAHAAGARTRMAGPLTCVIVVVAAIVGASWIESAALAIIGGLMVFVASRIADPWGFALLRAVARERTSADAALRNAFLTYLAVALSIVFLDVVAALAVGVIVSAATFVHTMNQHVVRSVTLGPRLRSRRLFPAAIAARLAQHLETVALVELQGPLFFGTADRIVEEVHKLPQAVSYIVLDLRRVQALDATASAVLARLEARMQGEDRKVIIASAAEGLAAVEGSLPARFPDRDRAMEWIEERLLATEDLTLAGTTLQPDAFGAFLGLDAAGTNALLSTVESRTLAAGEAVFRFGDPSDHLCFLLSGRISIVHGSGPAAIRVVTFLPGNVFGDVAFIDGKPRSANAVCDVESRVLLLHRSALDKFAAEAPAVLSRLYAVMANDLASRLRAADMLVRDAQ